MRPQLLIRKIHRWFGLILGIQILLWFASGFLMSWMPIEEIHGDHLLQAQSADTISLNDIDLTAIAKQVEAPIVSSRIKSWLGQTVVEVETTNKTHLFETPSMNLITPISEGQVRAVLVTHLLPQYEILSIQQISEVPPEARGRKAPLWQVHLSGDESPVIYISAETGEIVAKRVDRWRLFDFVWMLHIMDYDEREDFNHPLLYLTAFSAFLFTLSGFVLVFYSFRRRPKKTT